MRVSKTSSLTASFLFGSWFLFAQEILKKKEQCETFDRETQNRRRKLETEKMKLGGKVLVSVFNGKKCFSKFAHGCYLNLKEF